MERLDNTKILKSLNDMSKEQVDKLVKDLVEKITERAKPYLAKEKSNEIKRFSI